jgi:RHS repeat-associated protein
VPLGRQIFRLLLTGGAEELGVRRLLTINGGAGTSSTHFLYDGDRLVGEYDSNNVMQQRYIHGQNVDELLAAYQGVTVGAATRSFMLANHQGSVVALANSGGSTTRVNTYSGYGVPGTANAERFQYTGQAWLPEVGLYYYKARMYSPEHGRFMQTDPIGYEDDLNLYAYVGNDPTNARDPTGTESAEIILWTSCRQQGGSDCGPAPHLYAVDAFSDALPGLGAIQEYEKGNYVAAGVIGALDRIEKRRGEGALARKQAA